MPPKKRAPKKPIEDDGLLPETSSQGGPVLVVPAEHAAAWKGAPSDYDRACEPDDFTRSQRGGFGRLSVGEGTALVLDAELPTLWLDTDDGGVIVRGPETSGASRDELEALVPTDGWTPMIDALTLVDGRLFLFDSAARGAKDPADIDSDPRAAVGAPGPGTYAVSRASEGLVDFVRLVRAGGAKKKRAPAKKKAATKASTEPAWQTRAIAPYGLPGVPGPSIALEMYEYAAADDGTFYGPLGHDQKTMQVHRLRPGEALVPISTPGQFQRVALSHDQKTLYGITRTGQVFAHPVGGTGSEATLCFDGGKVVWKVAPLGPDRAAVSVGTDVKLLDTSRVPWQVLDQFDATVNQLPAIAPLDEGRWLVVGHSPKIFLLAVRGDRLQLVHTYVQTRSGIIVHGGRAYLYGGHRETYAHDEIMNLREIYDALP